MDIYYPIYYLWCEPWYMIEHGSTFLWWHWCLVCIYIFKYRTILFRFSTLKTCPDFEIFRPHLALCKLLYQMKHTISNSMALILGIYHLYKVTYEYFMEKCGIQKFFASIFDFEFLFYKEVGHVPTKDMQTPPPSELAIWHKRFSLCWK